jgi:hypothetical protein
LERVLEIKRDPITHVPFLEEVVKVCINWDYASQTATLFFLTSDDQLMEDGSNLVNHFWRVLSVNFEREIREATKGNTVRKGT